ncbi:MAG: hypothetical protein OER04_12380 [Cyclobacteriaceae bacterium]|nr:hypothetical protein [Cyclobacteriaceae bacterium]
MSRLAIIVVVMLFAISACAPYKPACNTKAGKKKLQYYNSIQYQKATKYSKKNNKKKRVAWSY